MMRGESTSIPPALPHHNASSTTATVPRRSIANRRYNRCLRMYANRKLRSSKLFLRLGPTYTPYHMMVESRPLYLLLCLITTPLRLQRRYHADPLPTGAAIVIYACMPTANYAVASSFFDLDQPTHHYHMMAESRPLYLLIRLIRPPLRLRRRYHADPLPTGTSNVVSICVPFANYAVASSFFDLDQPTHHAI